MKRHWKQTNSDVNEDIAHKIGKTSTLVILHCGVHMDTKKVSLSTAQI